MNRRAKTVSIDLLIGFAAALLTVYFLAEFHEELRVHCLRAFDELVTTAIRGRSSRHLDLLMLIVSFIGSWKVMLPVVALCGIWLIRSRHIEEALLFWASNAAAIVLSTLAKIHFARVRPDVQWALAHEQSYSFPSGHALNGVVVTGTIILFLCPYLVTPRGAFIATFAAASFVVIVGVIAGWISGLVWLSALWTVKQFPVVKGTVSQSQGNQ
jgi:membrane-associated phospholipid phosphatase